MPTKNIVGSKVRQARKEQGVTQQALAAKLQLMGVVIDRSAIAKLETNRRPVSDIEIAAIAKVLQVDIKWLFQEKESVRKQN